MSAQVTKANLIDALKQLRVRWAVIKQTWQDDAAMRFEREIIDPLEPAIMHACKGIEHVGELMQTVRRECGDDSSS